MGAESPRHQTRESAAGWFRETAVVAVIALAISVLVKTFLVQAFYIPSESMESTLLVNDRILVNKLLSPDALQRGDVVVFTDPGDWLPEPAPETNTVKRVATEVLTFIGILPGDAGEHLIKRVVGLPGDRVACCTTDGRLTVNGTAVEEPYLDQDTAPSEFAFDVVVPAGRIWVMGDNRSNSADSRAHMGQPGGGFVPLDRVVGRAFVIMWPFDRIGPLGGGQQAFAGVPAP